MLGTNRYRVPAMRSGTHFSLLSILFVLLQPVAAVAEGPRVVVSIAPVHALVAGVMDRVGIPDLLVRPDVAPYGQTLRLTQRARLAEADLVVWAGGTVDGFLSDAIAELAPDIRVIRLLDLELPARFDRRADLLWPSVDDPDSDGIDAHLWLDADNAVAIVEQIARALIEIDRAHKIDYGRNAEIVEARLGAMDRQLRAALQPFQGRPYLIQYDAFQYLERRYGLTAIGALQAGPYEMIRDDHGAQMAEEAAALETDCVFSVPQVDAQGLIEFAGDFDLTVVPLDPFQSSEGRGVNVYIETMRAIPKAFQQCLGQ